MSLPTNVTAALPRMVTPPAMSQWSSLMWLPVNTTPTVKRQSRKVMLLPVNVHEPDAGAGTETWSEVRPDVASAPAVPPVQAVTLLPLRTPAVVGPGKRPVTNGRAVGGGVAVAGAADVGGGALRPMPA